MKNRNRTNPEAKGQGSSSSPKPDEAFCKRAFGDWLRVRRPTLKQTWKYVDKPDRDFNLLLEERKYAVEVTRVPLLETTFLESLKDFVRRIEQDVLRQGILRGTYVVAFESFIHEFGKVKAVLHKRVVEYVRRTRLVSQAEKETVFEDDKKRTITVLKPHDRMNKLIHVLPPLIWWEGQVVRELRQLLRDAASRKSQDLTKDTGQLILLLYHDFLPAEPQHYLQCVPPLRKTGEFDPFRAVFLIYGEGKILPLYQSSEG